MYRNDYARFKIYRNSVTTLCKEVTRPSSDVYRWPSPFDSNPLMRPSFAIIKAALIMFPEGMAPWDPWFVCFLNKVVFLILTSCLLTYLHIVLGAE